MSDAERLFAELENLATQLSAGRTSLEQAQAELADARQAGTSLEASLHLTDSWITEAESRLAEQEDALKLACEARQAAIEDETKLRERFENAAQKNGLSIKSVAAHYERLKAAVQTRDHAADVAASQQATRDLTSGLLGKASESRKKMQEQKEQTDAAIEANARRVQQVLDHVENLEEKLDTTRTALGDEIGPVAAPQRPLGGLVDLYRKQGEETIKDFLTIRTRRIDFDEWADEAFGLLEEWAENQTTADAVRRSTLEAGIGSHIDEVTKKLNRRRIKDIRREILARTYTVLLRSRIERGAPGQADQPFKVKRKVARDHTGLADTISLDLDSKEAGGLRDTFSEMMTTIAVRNLSLDAPKGSAQFEILKAKICAST